MKFRDWFFGSKYVYVVIANEEEKVKECRVFSNLDAALNETNRLRDVYGGANVCLVSREINPEMTP